MFETLYIIVQVSTGIEQCRMACGGHGYMSASNLPELYGVAVGGCTYEGDNIVLYLQVQWVSLIGK
jgi:acyl-CoA oxidase